MNTPSPTSRNFMHCRFGALFASVGLLVLGSAANAQVIPAPFDASYQLVDIGTPGGVPGPLGGLTLKDGDPNTLLIGGSANAAGGAIYAVPLQRNADGHITGFSGPATLYAAAPNIDGGLAYGPGGVLFFTSFPNHRLGQIKPGSTAADKFIDLGPQGVSSSVGSVNFVAPGFPGAGGIRLLSFSGGGLYSAPLTPDGNGTFDLGAATLDTPVGGGPEGIVWVPQGSAQFPTLSVLVSEYASGRVSAYDLNVDGVPVPASRRDFVTGLGGAEGAFIDPQTNDFLFSTFGGGNRVVIVRGFADPEPLTTLLYKKGDAVPGQDATFASFGLPAFDGDAVGFLATIKLNAGGSRKVIMGGKPISVLVQTGDDAHAAGVAGGQIKSFKDPVFGGGNLAFIGALSTKVGTPLPLSANDSGVWSDAGGTLALIAREGDNAPGTDIGAGPAKWRTFKSVAMPETGGAVFVATLQTGANGAAGPGNTTTANDTGLWRESGGSVALLLREGGAVNVAPTGVQNETVKTFAVLGSVSGSPDQRRSHRTNGGLLVRCQFTDGRTAIIEFPGNSNAYVLRAVDQNPVLLPDGADRDTIVKLGVPSAGEVGEAFLATLVHALKGQQLAIVSGAGNPENNDFMVRVTQGDLAPDEAAGFTGVTFAKFGNPILAGAGEHLVFPGALQQGVSGVTAGNDTGIWTDAGGLLRLVAREGSPAPGTTDGATFAKFLSIAADPDAEPVRNLAFTANLLIGSGVPAATSANKLGLWARDRKDKVHLLARTGSPLSPDDAGANVNALHALKPAGGSPGQGRSVNGVGQIVYRVTRGKAGQAIAITQMP